MSTAESLHTSQPAEVALAVTSNESSEVRSLKAQLRGMEILLQQNSALEKEVERLCLELDEATMGVQKKGYLYKFRDKEIYYASKWGLRYFVLQGCTLSYYGDDQERRPRRTFDLSKCFVRQEGAKKGGLYHVFSIYLGSDTDDVEDCTLLLRLSAENGAECKLWVDMLEQACAIGDEQFSSAAASPLAPESPAAVSREYRPRNGSSTPDRRDAKDTGNGSGDWDVDHVSIDAADGDDAAGLEQDATGLSPAMLTRVRSSSRMLRKAMSRQTMARTVLSSRAPTLFTRSGHRISDLSERTARSVAASTKSALGKDAAPAAHLPKSFPAFKPMHIHCAPSPLSSEAPSGMHNYRGFFNLGLIILTLTHVDLVVNNMAKYGLKVALPAVAWTGSVLLSRHEEDGGGYWATVTARVQERVLHHAVPLGWLLFWVAAALFNVAKEKLASKNLFSERAMLAVNFAAGTAVMALPCRWIWTSSASSPSANMLFLFQSVIMWMKLVSYSHANKDLRVAYRRARRAALQQEKDPSASDASLDTNAKPALLGVQQALSEVRDLQPPFLVYPQNLTVLNMAYLCVAPTLCYQLNYPRAPKVRWSYVAIMALRLVFVAAMMVFAVEQYIKPTLETAVQPLRDMDVPMIVERLLKLSIPSTYVWLLSFYLYFHLWLNLLAELTRFGDRQFYKDWWNAKTIDRYWRTWNMPVHHWITRHLYYPLIRAGASKITATFVVFAFSALLHELVVAVPFRHVSLHAFFGMFAQAPLIWLTKYIDKRFDNAFVGNALFWCVFCIVGQPMGVILYYYDLWKLSAAAADAVTMGAAVAMGVGSAN